MMIPREKSRLLFSTCILLLIAEVKLQSGPTYDTSEWIPVTPSSKDDPSQNTEQKTANDRVLSMDAPSQKFFPDEEYEYRKRIQHEDQQFLRPPPIKKEVEHPRPRKLKHPSEYKFETPPPPPSKIQPEINYYNGQSMSPYVFEQPTASKVDKPVTQQAQQNYYVPVQQLPNQRPVVNSYVAVPNIHPQVPAPNAPNLYEQYQLPFNTSFYQSLNPAVLNNEFYQAIGNNSQRVQQNIALKVPQQGLPITTKPVVPLQPAIEKETVQLVYVPIENLKGNPPAAQDGRNIYRQADAPKKETIPLNTIPQASQIPNFEPLEQPKQEKLVYNPPHLQQRPELIYQQKVADPQTSPENKQERLQNIEQDFIQQALQASKLQRQLQDDINPLKQFTTTPKSLRKPHQPPLAVFMESERKAEVSDVLNSLRGAKTIAVQDTVTPDSPKIFIGPSNLDSPYGYTKFPLPYLNNINGNRIERKIDQLPFFVAPVNYNTPAGYSKIALPSPHVGSVVISTPVPTSTTPEPILLDQNQLNPFTLRSVGYNPFDSPTPSRPGQNYLDNYGISNQGRVRYQSTPIPQVTESPLISPIKDIFEQQFSPPQPDVYYVQQDSQQTYRDSVPSLDIYRPELQEKTRLSSPPNTKQSSSALGHKENSQENSQLPDINPLELAINEFELHQINNQFDQGNKKVKHSTTRRPQSSRNYDDSQTVSTTRATVTRGRHTYENDPSTEKPVSRGRVRNRGRGSSSRTVTTTTTTPPPVENDKYTVLEEFVARQPTRGLPTESYGRFAAESETEAPRRSSTTSFAGNRYLPENKQAQFDYENSNLQVEGLEDRHPQKSYENIRSQRPQDERFENTRSQPTFESTPSQTQLEEGVEEELPQIRPQPQLENTRSKPKSDSIQSQDSKLEIPQASLEAIKPQTVQKSTQYHQKNTEIENIPTSVYSLGQPQTYESTHFNYDNSGNSQDNTKLFYENAQNDENIEISKTARPILEEAKVAPSHRFSSEVTSYENREPNQHLRPRERTKYQEYESNANIKPVVKQSVESHPYQSPTSKIADQVLEEQKAKPQSINDPSAFIENLFQPNFDQTYLSLQDQAVRSLLVPDLLAPSPKQQFPLYPNSEHIVSSTEAIVELPPVTEAETTTTTRTSRPRSRGRARLTTTPTSAPRRTAGRRKPVSRTSTERIVSSTEYSSREDSERSSSNSRQNFRSKSRPLQPEISDRISTTENDIRAFKEPALEGGFQAVDNREPPQSYMQFEHAIDDQQIITINPKLNQDIREYQVNNLPAQPTTERQQLILDYENTRLQSTPVLDVKVSHVAPEENTRNFDVITRPTEEEQYVKYNNVNNFRSGGVLNNNKPSITTTRAPTTTKARGRTRGRSRFGSTTKTTSRPVTRISTSSPLRTTSPEVEEQEFYGFIRQPASSQRNIQAQKPVQTVSRNEEPNVQFVGEIRPKYNSRKSQLQSSEEPEIAETPRPRVRSRTRAPARKTTNTYRQSDNDVNSSKISEQATRKSTTNRGRTRGSTHFRAQEYQKRESDDEDIANQNYPANFLQKIDVSSPTPAPAAFKITVDPMEDDLDDQSPDSSIYRPKFVAKTDGWSDPNGLSVEDKTVAWYGPNGLPVEDKTTSATTEEQQEDTTSTDEPQALPVVQTTQNDELLTQFSDAEAEIIMANLEKIKTSPTEQSLTTLQPSETPTTQKKSRRKGGWKLVRQRPLDPLEVSESQNYQSVLNLFDSIEKSDHYTKGKSSQDKFISGKVHNDKESVDPNSFGEEINSFKDNHNEHSEIVSPNDVDEVVTVVTESDPTSTENTNDKEAYHLLTTTPSTFKTQENIFDTIYEMFGMFNKQEEKKNETTVSSDNTEKDKPVTTTVNPIFPEEITEESSTKSAQKTTDDTVVNDDENKKEDNSDKSDTATTTTPPITTPEVKSSTKPYEVEPWKMRAVKTSTSTEVSHETEICYKGRCVKSKEKMDN